MSKSKERKDWLSAAECAARTGLTVRALHVYERYGLIVPTRTAKGWRVYGQQDIARLNVVTALKAIGLSLSQIRDIVRASPPSLDRVLEIQVKTWRARKAEAERGLTLAEAAVAQLQAHQSLTIEDLCDLILNLENDGLQTIVDAVADEQFTATEKHNLNVWADDHWPNSEAIADAFVKTRADASKLVSDGVKPSSAKAQTFIERVMTIEREHSIFEGARQIGSAIVNAARGKQIAKALAKRMARGTPSQDHLAVEVFIDSARQIRLEKSRGWKRFLQTSRPVVSDIRQLIEMQADPASAQAQKMVGRFAKLRQSFSLGDPVFYALWAHEKGLSRGDLWEFVGRAERACATANDRHP